MKNRKIMIFAAVFAAVMLLLSSCDVVRLKYPGEKEGKAVFREETVDFVIYTDPESPQYSRGVICEGGEMLDFTIEYTTDTHFKAYLVNKADTLFEGTYYASGKLYGTGMFELEITSWYIEKPFEKTELVFKLHVE